MINTCAILVPVSCDFSAEKRNKIKINQKQNMS